MSSLPADVVVERWSELLDAMHAPHFMPRTPGSGGRARSKFVFRGMCDAAWELRTSIERLGSPIESIERPLLRNFQKYAPPGTFHGTSQWELLAVAQHNGLPTRCLDWTFSPLVAAHFATAEHSHHTKDGVIWCIDAIRWRNELIPIDLRDTLHAELSWIYDVRTLGKSFDRLTDLDTKFADAPGIMLLFEPPSIDARIANQGGILSVVSRGARSHHDYLIDVMTKCSGIVQRIVIKAGAKAEVRDMLDQNNIHERMLFPGLPGLCDWLRRYYSPA